MKSPLPIIISIILLSLSISGCSSASNDLSDPPQSDCAHTVFRHNPIGWLQTDPEIHFVFLGTLFWAPNQNTITYFQGWDVLLHGSFLDKTAEYGIHQGLFDDWFYNWDAPTPAKGEVLTDADITNFINSKIQSSELPYPNSNTDFVVMLPPAVITTTFQEHNWGGYHTHASYGSVEYTFAPILYGDVENSFITISHEIVEAATDPDGGGYYDAQDDEIMDLCDGVKTYVDGYVVQKVWSQNDCKCL